MKVGDLVQRCSTGKIDIVIDVILGAKLDANGPCKQDTEGEWLLLAGNQQFLANASNYKVISESR